MTTRRNVLRSIPAAIAIAILPSRLTRNVRAQDASKPLIEGVDYTVGSGCVWCDIDVSHTHTAGLVAVDQAWGVNRWQHGPVTITLTDGRVIESNGTVVIE